MISLLFFCHKLCFYWDEMGVFLFYIFFICLEGNFIHSHWYLSKYIFKDLKPYKIKKRKKNPFMALEWGEPKVV